MLWINPFPLRPGTIHAESELSLGVLASLFPLERSPTNFYNRFLLYCTYVEGKLLSCDWLPLLLKIDSTWLRLGTFHSENGPYSYPGIRRCTCLGLNFLSRVDSSPWEWSPIDNSTSRLLIRCPLPFLSPFSYLWAQISCCSWWFEACCSWEYCFTFVVHVIYRPCFCFQNNGSLHLHWGDRRELKRQSWVLLQLSFAHEMFYNCGGVDILKHVKPKVSFFL